MDINETTYYCEQCGQEVPEEYKAACGRCQSTELERRTEALLNVNNWGMVTSTQDTRYHTARCPVCGFAAQLSTAAVNRGLPLCPDYDQMFLV